MAEKRTYGPVKTMIVRCHSTSLYRDDLNAWDEAQPFACELGYLLTDENGAVPDVVSNIIRTEGRISQSQATAIHGLSAQQCDQFGASEMKAIGLMTDLLKVPTYRHMKVVTYTEHDQRVITAMISRIGKRVGKNFANLWETRPQTEFITLQDPFARTMCRLPADEGGYRRPTLREAEKLVPHFDRAALERMGLPLSLIEMLLVKEIYMAVKAAGMFGESVAT